MLAQANRITQGSDYRSVVRKGRRFVAPLTVTYVRAPEYSASATASVTPRFGFIVAKSVGGAVVRNRVRRRLKAICYELLAEIPPGSDVVIRALPEAASQPYRVLCDELTTSFRKGALLK